MAWGMANRPKTSNKLGIPTPGDGSDGDIQVRQTNLGAKLFGKIGGRWHSTFLSKEEEVVGTSGTAIKMSSSGTLSVNEIELTGKITLESRGTQNVCIGTGNADVGENNISIGVNAGSSFSSNNAQSNVCIGTCAGENMDASPQANVCIGNNTGDTITDGDSNTCIGNGVIESSLSGTLTDGTFNTYIGSRIKASGSGATGELVLCAGHTTTTSGKGDNTTTFGHSATVGTYINAGTLYLKMSSDDSADDSNYGQIWVDNTGDGRLMFTDNNGTKHTVDVSALP